VNGIIIIDDDVAIDVRDGHNVRGGAMNTRRGTACRAPTIEQFGKPVRGSLSTIIRSNKFAVTKHINECQKLPGSKLCQANFSELSQSCGKKKYNIPT